MKTTTFLILALLASSVIGRAQKVVAGQKSNVDPVQRQAAIVAAENSGAQPQASFTVPSTPIAEAETFDIQTLARGLENDPVRIFNYVHDHIRHVLYFGSKKGAELTLLEKSGNDFDQCALLVALLNAAGYTNTGYQFGWMELPYDSPDHKDLHHWLQLSVTNSNWGTTSNYLDNLIRVYRGYPADAAIWDTNTFAFQRTWVVLTNGSTVYYLDPSFKVSEPISGISLQTAMSFSSNSLMSAASGTDSGYSITGLSESAVRSTLTGYASNLLNYIQNNYPNSTVSQILSGWQIVPSTNTTLSQSLPFTTYTWGGKMPVLTWTYEPTNLMATFRVSFAGTNFNCFMPQLEGQRLTLTYDDTSFGQLWLEDTDVADNYDSTGSVVVSVHYPVGYWDTNNNLFVDTGAYDQTSTNVYDVYGSSVDPPYFNAYNLMYGFEPDWGRLQARQNYLDYLRSLGLGDESFDVVTETLNVMALQYMTQTWNVQQILSAEAGMLPQNYQIMGRMGQEDTQGYYFDIFMWKIGDISAAGVDSTNNARLANYSGVLSYFGSGLEHGVIEQLQNSNYVGASTVKMLEVAVTNGGVVYLANSSNWQTGPNIRTNLSGSGSGYGSGDLAFLDTLIAKGDYILIPGYGDYLVAGPGTWGGYGVVDRTTNWNFGLLVSGAYGGFVSDPNATVNSAYIALVGHGQPGRRPFRVSATGADPVDTTKGTFLVDQTDLSIGQAEPNGITFGRSYDSSERYLNPAAMGNGWINNYYANAKQITAAQAALGATTPQQMVPILAATSAALGIYNDGQHDAKNWTVSILIAKWGIDQLTKSGVSVQLGKDIIQFIQQPNGVFTPPANCTWTLSQPSNYVLQVRHGNTFNFDSLGRLTTVVDPYTETLTLKYNGNNLVTNVTDARGRFLNFNYSGSPLSLNSVSDSAGRSVSYGYTLNTTDSNLDLTSITDPESKTSTYVYNTDHALKATINAASQLVTTNIYDGSFAGRVTTQFAQGNTNKTWQVFWSGWETVLEDPAGSKQRYFYDDSSRLIGFQDALGNLSQTFFDGQDHLVMTVSPLNETNQFIYDGHHNLTNSIDPLGFTNQFIYDANNNMLQLIDARGNSDKFGYNSQFSLTGMTNGNGDWVNLAYNSDGTLNTRTDPGGTVQYGYDTYGQLNSITYPGGLGNESFGNDALGNVTSHTTPRGFTTAYQYNLRRQLTNAVAPTNLTVSLSYDSVGNLQAIKDARGFSTTKTWSPSRKLLATTLPATPQGTPVVTNIYDNRDWLARTLDPLQQPTLFTNDVAGRLVSATDPLSRTSTLGFDADSRKVASTNGAQEVTTLQWNTDGRFIKRTDNANHSIIPSYDGNGNQTVLTNRNTNSWQFRFDAANRLTNTITPLNRKFQQVWNNRGLLQSLIQPDTTTASFYYDAKARLTNRTDILGSTFFQYDSDGNATNIFENGRTNIWVLDAYDRVVNYTDADGNQIQYRYDANGNVTNLVYPGSRTVSYFYDSLNRLTNVTDWASRTTTLTYDLAGRLQTITRPNGTVRTMNYDVAGEVTNIIEEAASKAPIAFFRFNYDNAARIHWEFEGPLPHSYSLQSRSMTFDADNRLITLNGQNITNDLNGNMTWGPLTNSAFSAYTFDARNRLLSAGGLTYGYSPTEDRTVVTNGAIVTKFIIDPNTSLPRVLMRVRSGITNYYVYGPGLLYEVDESAAGTSVLTYHYDSRGSTVALTDNNGNITDHVEYSSYGITTFRSGTNDTPFLFNGEYGVQTDSNGLLYMRARYYNPYICRFINPDPAGFAGGLNWYAYADGNPVSLIDPFGLGAVEGWGGATATWINKHLVRPLNAVSTTSTTVNFASYMAASFVGGLSDLLRLGQGTAAATYNAQDGWDVAIGVTEDIQRACGLTTLLAGGFEESVGDPLTEDLSGNLASFDGANSTELRPIGGSRNTTPLTPEQIEQIYQHVDELGLSRSDVIIYNGPSAYSDMLDKILIGPDAFPGELGDTALSQLSPRAVVAHEAGHMISTTGGFSLEAGTVADEIQATLVGRSLPGLSQEDIDLLSQHAAELGQ